jgi:thioredoxin-like negative regulator of GroEL
LILAHFILAAGSADAASFGSTRIDLDRGVDFYGFMSRADGQDIKRFLGRIDDISLSDRLRAVAESVDKPVIIVVYGYTWCGDMAILAPYIESVRRTNPGVISAKFYIRGDEDADFLIKQTGIDRTPAIFLAAPDGRLLEGRYYSKFPKVVQDLIDSSKSEEESQSHIEDHRAGEFDDEVQGDLAEFLSIGFSELRGL